jgi:hypothetical protein
MANLKGCGRKIGSHKIICAEFVVWAKEEAARIERGEADRYHAVLCDPPYGLEFMGKEWDAPHKFSGALRADGMNRKSVLGGILPQFDRIANVRCRTCGGWLVSHPKTKCQCAEPDFPNAILEQRNAYQDWTHEWASALIPLLYPGALVFCFGGTRTWHRLACGFEDAGFQIWDTINYCSTEDPDYRCGWLEWYHGSGFPKA